MNFFDQLRSLDPRDVGRWPVAVRGFFVLLGYAVVAAAGWYFFLWNDERPLLHFKDAREARRIQPVGRQAVDRFRGQPDDLPLPQERHGA